MASSAVLFPCPACGFLVFSEPPGSYEICDLCGWEDDHVQLRYPRSATGANAESLLSAQQRALEHTPIHIQEKEGHTRDPQWYPLASASGADECGPVDGREYCEEAASDSPSYYWRK